MNKLQSNQLSLCRQRWDQLASLSIGARKAALVAEGFAAACVDLVAKGEG